MKASLPASDGGALSDSALQGEAADWLVRMHGGPLSPQEQRTWLAWRRLSTRHEAAWRRAEDVLGVLRRVPPDLAREIVPQLADRKRSPARRRVLAALAAGAGIVPLAWIASRGAGEAASVLADHTSAVGEVRTVMLPDGTRVVLNTGTAIDVKFDAFERRVVLRVGEILVQTAPDPKAVKRPFRVQTAQGYARALGTRYTVRQYDGDTRVAVYDGAVALSRTGQERPFAVLRPGDAMRFGEYAQSPLTAADPAALAWSQGMLVARDMPLDMLLQELGRYRRGLLYATPGASALRVSGAFPIDDTDRSLALLADTMPVRIVRRTSYWVTVDAR